jgi:dTDP-4-dehydrorhamnose 3,5-epimerase
VDLRRSSATFGQWAATTLSVENRQQLWVPVGFAHGFLTFSETAEMLYKASSFWSKSCERSLRWDDPQLAIAWPPGRCLREDTQDQFRPLRNALRFEFAVWDW